MTQQEYDKKRRECWEEFWNPDMSYTAFSNIFDRAYSLGKQTETITQEEIEKVAKKYAAEVDKNVRDLYGIEEQPASLTFGECAAESFREGVKFALGKQEKDAEAVIQGWVARASDGHLVLFKRKPDREIYMRSNNNGLWFGGSMTELDSNLFPDLTWDDEPIECEIIIKRKKNG